MESDVSYPKLFEIGWEVCLKQGGIYTYLTNKASVLSQTVEDYYLIGPWIPHKADGLFCHTDTPDWLSPIVDTFKKDTVLYGYWDIPGRPNTILLDISQCDTDFVTQMLEKQINESHCLENEFMKEEFQFSEILFRFLNAIHQHQSASDLSLRFHEWQSSVALLAIKQCLVRFTQIEYTLHGTQYGRIAQEWPELKSEHFQPAHIPNQFIGNAHVKHKIENVILELVDKTLVLSKRMQVEVHQILSNKKTHLSYPGLNVSWLNERVDLDEASSVRDRLFKYFSTDTEQLTNDNTTIIYTGGRMEYKSKGFDITLDAINALNQRLQVDKSDKRVIVIIISFGCTVETGNSFDEMLSRKEETPAFLLAPSFYDLNNPIISTLIEYGFDEQSSFPVKCLYLPTLPEKMNTILGQNYLSMLKLSDLALFPSRYEPWGYIGHESLLMGTPCILSEQSGLADYIQTYFPSLIEEAVYLVDADESVNHHIQRKNIVDVMMKFVNQYSHGKKEDLLKLIQSLDWHNKLKHEHKISNKIF